MQHYETPDIKRHPNGSIDTAYYMLFGRKMRSEQAHKLAKAILPKKKTFSLRIWFPETIRA
ncbi:hypothetical protein N4R57_14225 [Rhodobacteraceae bacterium D3-12]|nr:hypothetical protein N4R57_14225 [Rhodobacteraceae bacterium D3-12]